MNSIHYSLRCNAYKSNLFSGFSQLQQREEFVDLTLAADGCIVKVHRNLIALASPYLREILKSTSNQSPVLFLNNVSHQVLAYLLEYIYQGEVNIPVESVDAFIEVSKSLHIAGIEDLEPPKTKLPPKRTVMRRKPPDSNLPAQIPINNGLIVVQQTPLSDNLEKNNTDYSMHDQEHTTELLNNAKLIIHQNQGTPNKEMLQNIALIEMERENRQVHTNDNEKHIEPNTQQNPAAIPDQQNLNEPSQNIPIIEITSNTEDQQHSQTKPSQYNDFKIIVKTQNNQAKDTDESQKNIPVIEIQHFGPLVQQQESNETFPCVLPTLTDKGVKQAFPDNPTPTETDDQTQNVQAHPNKRNIKILDEIIIKSGITLPEMNSGSDQIPISELKQGDILPLDSKFSMNDMKNMAQYSVTERGALQMILNRYMYCCHHKTRTKQRWRCTDYRRAKCLAVVDTEDGVIVARKGVHAHTFHDNKIFKKHERGHIFQTVELALAARDSAQMERLRTASLTEIDEDDVLN